MSIAPPSISTAWIIKSSTLPVKHIRLIFVESVQHSQVENILRGRFSPELSGGGC